jgi:gliding motility-associated lipoprotein GldH
MQIHHYVFMSVIFVLSSCGPKVIYESGVTFPDQIWTYQDSIAFTFTPEKAETAYDLVLSVNHAIDFTWENVYIEIHTINEADQRTVQPLSINLSNGFGQWKGECGGDNCEIDILLATRRYKNLFEQRLVFYQHSREEALEGINQLSFKIVEVAE